MGQHGSFASDGPDTRLAAWRLHLVHSSALLEKSGGFRHFSARQDPRTGRLPSMVRFGALIKSGDDRRPFRAVDFDQRLQFFGAGGGEQDTQAVRALLLLLLDPAIRVAGANRLGGGGLAIGHRAHPSNRKSGRPQSRPAASQVLIVESAIDALSHAQLYGGQFAYVSLGGAISDHQRELLEGLITKAHARGTTVGVGTDNDDQGEVYWKLLLALGADFRQLPRGGKDWNDDLTYSLSINCG